MLTGMVVHTFNSRTGKRQADFCGFKGSLDAARATLRLLKIQQKQNKKPKSSVLWVNGKLPFGKVTESRHKGGLRELEASSLPCYHAEQYSTKSRNVKVAGTASG